MCTLKTELDSVLFSVVINNIKCLKRGYSNVKCKKLEKNLLKV